MKKFIVPLVLLILMGLQNSLFEYIRVFGIKPDIVLTFIICFTLIRGNPLGTLVGVLGGGVEDIFFGGAFGINSIGCMVSAYLIGVVEGKIYKDNIFIPGIFTFVGTVVKESVVFLFLYLTRANMELTTVFLNIVFPEAIYNMILAGIFFKYMVKISNKLSTEQLKV